MLTASTTTIELKLPTKDKLDRYRKPGESNDGAVSRALDMKGRVYVDIIAIDGEFARTSQHKIIFQVGDKPPNFYEYSGGRITEVDPPKMKLDAPPSKSFGMSGSSTPDEYKPPNLVPVYEKEKKED